MKKTNLILIMLSLFILASCSKEPDVIKQIELKYAIVDGSGTHELYTLSEVALIFFDKANGTQKARVVQAISGNVDSSKGSILIDIPSTLEAGDYDVLVIANYNRYLPVSGTTTIEYLESLSTKSFTEMENKLKVKSTERIVIPMPMPYSAEGTVTIEANKSRVVLDVFFNVKATDFFLNNLIHSSKFKILWAKVCNYRNEVTLFLDNDIDHKYNPGEIVPGLSTNTSTSDVGVTTPILHPSGYQVVGNMYAFPNISFNTTSGDKKTTFIMIAGEYNGVAGVANYYRMNIYTNKDGTVIGRDNNNQNIKPPQRYGYDIHDVGPGWRTEQEAAYGSGGDNTKGLVVKRTAF